MYRSKISIEFTIINMNYDMKIKLPRHILQKLLLMKLLEQILNKKLTTSSGESVCVREEREREREREFSIRECIKRPYNMLINIHYLN